jgi:hypothetical protein
MADFNLDGKPDLAVEFTNAIKTGVVVMPGDGAGRFRLPATTDLSFYGATSAGDFNGDGKADLVIVTGSANLFLGNGDQTFQSPLTFAVGAGSMECRRRGFQ